MNQRPAGNGLNGQRKRQHEGDPPLELRFDRGVQTHRNSICKIEGRCRETFGTEPAPDG
jgi:hypothetical protein